MKITFKPLCEDDFTLLLKWLMTPHVSAWWDQDIQWTLALVQEKYSSYVKGYKLENRVAKPISAYIICVDNAPIGYIQIYNAYDFSRSQPLTGLPSNLAAFDIFIGEENYLRQGIASKAIVQFLREQVNSYPHILVDPESTNIAAIRTYEKVGFKKIKVQPGTGELWMIREQTMTIHFEKANLTHIDIIWSWLAEPYVQEFWDNTSGHKEDILNFVNGRKEPSNYCDGKYIYWIASCDGHPFAMLMTIQDTAEDHIDDIKLNHLSKTGHTYGIDYMIGNKNYFGKGYGAKTLSEFLDFFKREFDVSADTFIIDPACDNPKAKHVYMKAGFEHIADFVMSGDVSGAGKAHHLLIKRFTPNAEQFV